MGEPPIDNLSREALGAFRQGLFKVEELPVVCSLAERRFAGCALLEVHDPSIERIALAAG